MLLTKKRENVFTIHANRHRILILSLHEAFFQVIHGLWRLQIFVLPPDFSPENLSASNAFCQDFVVILFPRILSEFVWEFPPKVRRHCDLMHQTFRCIYNHRNWPLLWHLWKKSEFILETLSSSRLQRTFFPVKLKKLDKFLCFEKPWFPMGSVVLEGFHYQVGYQAKNLSSICIWILPRFKTLRFTQNGALFVLFGLFLVHFLSTLSPIEVQT